MNRRETLGLMIGAAACANFAGRGVARAQQPPAAFTLPPLGYPFEALEPHIDAMTMRIHHGTHHAAYVNNLNGLAAKWPDLANTPAEEILSDLSVVPGEVVTGVRNNLGGHWNHTFFWELMTPGGAKEPTEEMAAAINGAFGDLAKMKAAVKQAALGQFGAGWAWLALNRDRKLVAFALPNQDTPHMYSDTKPILGIDVWEHAYYLKHQARRGDYIDAWWNTLNWDNVAENFYDAAR